MRSSLRQEGAKKEALSNCKSSNNSSNSNRAKEYCLNRWLQESKPHNAKQGKVLHCFAFLDVTEPCMGISFYRVGGWRLERAGELHGRVWLKIYVLKLELCLSGNS